MPRLQWFVPVINAIPEFAQDVAAFSVIHALSWKKGEQDNDSMFSGVRCVFEDLKAKYGEQIQRLAADPANGFPVGFVFKQGKLFHLRQIFRNEHVHSPALEAALDLAGCCGEEKQKAARAHAASLGLFVAPAPAAPAVLRLSSKEDVEAGTQLCTMLRVVVQGVIGSSVPAVFSLVKCMNRATVFLGPGMLANLQALPDAQVFPCMRDFKHVPVGLFGKQTMCGTCQSYVATYGKKGKFVPLVPGRVAGNAHGDACPIRGECKLHGAATRGPFTLPPPPPPAA